MKKLKAFIIIIVIIIIILLVGLLYLQFIDKNSDNDLNNNSDEEISYSNNTEDENNASSEDGIDEEYEDEKDIREVTDRSKFYTVENCIRDFIEYNVKQEFYCVYALLDQNYIDENQITEENIQDKIENYTDEQIITITEMYMQKTEQEGYTRYYTHLKIRGSKETTMRDYFITVILNDNDMYYTIYPGEDFYSANMKNYYEK